jgi:predicted nucleic acid-binding protein
MNLVDTSGWIEYFFAGPNASRFAVPIEKTGDLIVPVICLYEVFKKINQVGDEARALQAIAQMKHGRVMPVTEEIALKAALISLRHKLPMADSVIYTTGLAERATVWTQDDDFQGLPGVNYVKAKTTLNSQRSRDHG